MVMIFRLNLIPRELELEGRVELEEVFFCIDTFEVTGVKVVFVVVTLGRFQVPMSWSQVHSLFILSIL